MAPTVQSIPSVQPDPLGRVLSELALTPIFAEGGGELGALKVAVALEATLGITLHEGHITPEHLGSQDSVRTTLRPYMENA